jgi:hypothetical protein
VLAQTITKLLDESILPAVVIIAAKVLGLVLINFIAGLPYTIQVGGSILPVTVVYASAAEAETANTFSNLVMELIVLLGFAVILFRAHFLHESHVPPKLSSRLVQLKLEHFILSSFEIYHQALIWLSFLWLSTAVVFVYAFAGGSISLALICFLLSFLSTYLYTKDIEVEIETERLLRAAH